MLHSLAMEPAFRVRAASAPEHSSAALPRGLFTLLFAAAVILSASLPLSAADHGTIIREAIVYISPDPSSHKLAQAERGREVILLDKSRNWVQVEALLGYTNAPDDAFVYDDDEQNRKTVSGW